MSQAKAFRDNIQPTRRANYRRVMDHLEQHDPDLLAAINDVLADDHLSLAAIHRSVRDVGIDIGYSSLIRWRDHVRG